MDWLIIPSINQSPSFTYPHSSRHSRPSSIALENHQIKLLEYVRGHCISFSQLHTLNWHLDKYYRYNPKRLAPSDPSKKMSLSSCWLGMSSHLFPSLGRQAVRGSERQSNWNSCYHPETRRTMMCSCRLGMSSHLLPLPPLLPTEKETKWLLSHDPTMKPFSGRLGMSSHLTSSPPLILPLPQPPQLPVDREIKWLLCNPETAEAFIPQNGMFNQPTRPPPYLPA